MIKINCDLICSLKMKIFTVKSHRRTYRQLIAFTASHSPLLISMHGLFVGLFSKKNARFDFSLWQLNGYLKFASDTLIQLQVFLFFRIHHAYHFQKNVFFPKSEWFFKQLNRFFYVQIYFQAYFNSLRPTAPIVAAISTSFLH